MTLADVADENGWKENQTFIGRRGTWSIWQRGDILLETWRDRWRHTTGRAYRDNRLTGVFRTQREITAFLSDPPGRK